MTFDWNWFMTMGFVILICKAAYFFTQFIKTRKARLSDSYSSTDEIFYSIVLPELGRAQEEIAFGKFKT